MKKIFTILMVAVTTVAMAQEEDTTTEDKISVGLSLNMDQFFGLNPMMTFAYDVSESGSFTAYGIQWGAGTGSAWGQWTEFGVGYNYAVGDFDINPQLGFTFGSLLSSGAVNEGIIGDGIVPNLTVNYGTDKLEGQLYFGYYAPLSDNTSATLPGQDPIATNAYTHYWINLGYKFNSFISAGAHFEDLALVGGETFDGVSLENIPGYTGFGPYIQFTKGNAGMRLSVGANIADEDERFSNNDFYKLQFFVNL